ncbi:hypothetical protein FQA47_003921 [Oryzias melastigma]|uniref:G-protein coupled receptors family 1 profile domain-containing protein n=1 Tax=Oryzias melastigma TaxID=30732 RepID=A0A834C8M8_ORYME|nr:hypothetical protein FQA47_003921 [Oryzias melastigma]
MAEIYVNLLGLRIAVSFTGLVGNVCLILSIVHIKWSHIKSFELFLLGLAAANLEEIVIINVYDLFILQSSFSNTWSCRFLKFMTMFGETASIFFTVIISIFRYQKLAVSLSVPLDRIGVARLLSGVCVMVSFLLSFPVVAIKPTENATNSSGSRCSAESFHCGENYCPTPNCAYKYLFVLVSYLLPLIIITVTNCLIITVLLIQRRTITPEISVHQPNHNHRKGRDLRFQHSTIAVVAAMALFLVEPNGI